MRARKPARIPGQFRGAAGRDEGGTELEKAGTEMDEKNMPPSNAAVERHTVGGPLPVARALALLLGTVLPACEWRVDLTYGDGSEPAVPPGEAEREADSAPDAGGDDGGSGEPEAVVDVETADDAGTEAERESAGDGDVEDGPGGETGPCTPTLSEAGRLAASAADGEERPAVTAGTDRFVAVVRTPSADGRADALHTCEVACDGVTMSNRTVLGGVEVRPEHPVTRITDRAAAMAFGAPEGPLPGLWVKIVLFGADSPLPQQIPGTDADSTQPSLTYSGTDVVVAWAQPLEGGAGVEIRAQRFSDVDGLPFGDAVTLAAGPAGTREPRIAGGGRHHALAYFDASDGALHVLTLDETLAELAEHVLPPPAGHALAGYPALAWAGGVFGLAWETRGVDESAIHLATFAPGEAPSFIDPLTGIVALEAAEEGQVALAWAAGADEWGIAWQHRRGSRVSVALARIGASDRHVIEGPIDVSPDATAALHPALAYEAGYYIAAWVEQAGTDWPVYQATYGCPLGGRP
jgi:hypothetical protein